jgi:hypothetical protein
VAGLTTGQAYYFLVRTYTPAHDDQQSDLWSEYTVEVSGIQRTLRVEEKSSAGTIVGILVILFALGGGAYLYSTGRLNEMLGQIKNR